MDRFNVACIIFSLITGVYLAHLVTESRGCTVAFNHGQETHVYMGHQE